ncbi:hypothetical protein BpHYR1_053975 [Brachionus plicatilis]|uniref:Uncharacterized protein n=1 Tax=Brachionus plicatilis TaxID=10195 RepID=A0A3M7PPM2_BRAPC|nr:hypothetical protein BpHYR1_053975 [Brachionus plicatilis]
MSLSTLADNKKALISFSDTFLSNGSDLTQRLLHRVDHRHRYYYPVETSLEENIAIFYQFDLQIPKIAFYHPSTNN